MVEIELTEDSLVVHVKGMDKLWAAKSTVAIPIGHITAVELGVVAAAQDALQGSLRFGTHLPHVITAGRFYRDKKIAFWDVHKGDSAITIHVAHDDYTHLVVEVEDPWATVQAIRARIAPARG